VKGILAISKGFEVGESFTLRKMHSLGEKEKGRYLMEPSNVLQAEVSCTLFSLESCYLFIGILPMSQRFKA
jgi:hypothetical protein